MGISKKLREEVRMKFGGKCAYSGTDLKDELRSWPEDYSHENGNYNCICCYCGKDFIGHKRRVACKVCSKI